MTPQCQESADPDRGGLMTMHLPTFEDEPAWLAQSGAPSKRTTTWLHIAWERQARVEHYRDTLNRAEPAHDRAPPRSGHDRTNGIDRSDEIFRLTIRCGEFTRILDMEMFRREYPEIYAKYFGRLVMPGIAEGETDRGASGPEMPITESAGGPGILCEPAEIPLNTGELP